MITCCACAIWLDEDMSSEIIVIRCDTHVPMSDYLIRALLYIYYTRNCTHIVTTGSKRDLMLLFNMLYYLARMKPTAWRCGRGCPNVAADTGDCTDVKVSGFL